MQAMALPTFEIDATEPERGVVIWLHGLGATNHDFDTIVPELDAAHLRFVFPAAPVRPVTINQGMRMPAWYDILSFDDPPLREDEADVRATTLQIRELIDREVARGVRSDKIVLAGFSQGGAIALHVGLRSEKRLAGVLVLSGYLLMPDTLADETQPEARLTPFLFCHGRYDPVVPVRLGQSSFARVTNAGYAAEWVEYDMQHSLCLDEVRRIKTWLAQRLPREA